MNLIARLKQWAGRDDKESPYVCVYCGADPDRNYRQCPECGKPYVTPRTDAES